MFPIGAAEIPQTSKTPCSEYRKRRTDQHVRPEVVYAVNRICVVGLEGCACGRRNIDMLAFEDGKASLLEWRGRVKSASNGDVEKVKGRR